MPELNVIHCPQCKTALKIGNAQPGQIKCKCPKCGSQFGVTVRAPTTAMLSKAPATGLDSQNQSPPGEKLTKTKLETPTKAQESLPIEKVVKTKLEMPSSAKVQKSPPAEKASSHEASNATRPPVSRSSRTHSAARGRWILAGATLFVLLGMLSICVLRIDWFRRSLEQEQTRIDDKKIDDEQKKVPPGVRLTRKLNSEEFASRALIIPFDAVGTRQRLYKIQMVQLKGKAKFNEKLNDEQDFIITSESLRQVKCDELSETLSSNVLLIRNRGLWVKDKKFLLPLEKDLLSFHQNFNYALILSSLIPLTENRFDAISGNDEDVGDAKCFSAVVTHPGRHSMNLYFDKKTKLLLKVSFKGTFLDADGKLMKDTRVDFFFSGHKVTDGVQHWRKYRQLRNEILFAEIELSEVTFFNKLDNDLFVLKGFERQVEELLDTNKAKDIERAVFGLPDEKASDFSRLVRAFSRNQDKRELHLQMREALLDFADLWRKGKTRLERADVKCLDDVLKSGDPVELQSFAIEAMLQLEPERLELSQLADLMERANVQNRAVARVNLLNKLRQPVTSKDLPALRNGLKNPPDRDLLLAFIDATGSLKEAASIAVPDLIPHLKSEKEISDKAARALDKMEALVDVVDKNSDRSVLLAGLRYLSTKGVQPEKALDAYEKRLGHPDSDVKNLAAVALLKHGPKRLPLDERLMELADRPNEEVRALARKHLREMLAKPTSNDLRVLREGLKKRDPELALDFINAVGLLKKEETSKAVPELIPLLKSKKDISDHAALVLHKIGKLVEIVRDAKNTDPDILFSAIEYLRNMGDDSKEAKQAYKERLVHLDGKVRDSAALALLKLAGEELDPKAVLAFVDMMKWPNVHDSAVELLNKKLKIATKEYLQGLRATENSAVKNSASFALVNLGAEKLELKEVLELVDPKKWPNEKGRAAALKVLEEKVQTVKKEYLTDLRNGLRDSSVQRVRLVLIDAIGKLKDNYAAAPELAERLAAEDDESIQAIEVLKSMGNGAAKAVPDLEKLVEREGKLAVSAAQALCKIAPESKVFEATKKGIPKGIALLFDDLKSDANNLKNVPTVPQDLKDLSAFLNQPAEGGKSATALVEIGAPAADLVYKYLLNDPKNPMNQNIIPTAIRFRSYMVLEQFAKKAKSDTKLAKALKDKQFDLQKLRNEETRLSEIPRMYAEVRTLYIATKSGANRAWATINTNIAAKKLP